MYLKPEPCLSLVTARALHRLPPSYVELIKPIQIILELGCMLQLFIYLFWLCSQ